MSSVNVWQETVQIPTYETGAQDTHPCFWRTGFIKGLPGQCIPMV